MFYLKLGSFAGCLEKVLLKISPFGFRDEAMKHSSFVGVGLHTVSNDTSQATD